MLLGLEHPDRIEQMIVLSAPHPWPHLRPALLRELWRAWYAGAVATPVLGPWLHRRTGFAKGILRRGTAPGTFSPEELDEYADSFREPARARGMSALYRYYHSGFLRAFRGGWRDRRLTVPTLLLIGAGDLYVSPQLMPGYEAYVEDMRVEVVPETGHFLVNERPELVVDRAREFFGT